MVLQRDGRGPLIPDFVLEPLNQSKFCDVLELKLPTADIFVLKEDRERFSASVFEACAQLRVYKEYFDDPENRRKFKARYKLSAYRPQMMVIIGRRGKVNPFLARNMETELPTGLRLRTYDDVIDRAKARLVSRNRKRK